MNCLVLATRMGINGLSTYVSDQLPSPPQKLDFTHLPAPRIVVCDALGFVRTFYRSSIDWIRGGQWDAGFGIYVFESS